MSETDDPMPVRPRPSVQLVRAAVLSGIIGGLAMVLHRVELLVLAAPFLVWCGIGWWRMRTVRVEPAAGLSGGRFAVGQTVGYRVEIADQEAIVAVSVRQPPWSRIEPGDGAVIGLGHADVAIRPLRWGRHQVKPRECSAVDAWGTWIGRWTPPHEAFTVEPELDVPGGSDLIPRPIGLVGIHPSLTRGDGSQLAEIRLFTAGDRLRRINWRVTSRTGALHTNATTADRDTEVLIVVDTLDDLAAPPSGSAGTEQASSSLDIAIAAASSLADHYLGLGDRVGLHDLGRVIGTVHSGSGARHRGLIMQWLAQGRADRASGTGSVQPVGRLRAGTLVLCCTPVLSPQVVEELLRLRHRGATVLVIDTMPPTLGRLDSLRPRSGWRQRAMDRTGGARFWDEAWALRRLGREQVLDSLRELGIPVVVWQGVGGLSEVIRALAANRSAPRMVRR